MISLAKGAIRVAKSGDITDRSDFMCFEVARTGTENMQPMQ
jgi:hypothetical protein